MNTIRQRSKNTNPNKRIIFGVVLSLIGITGSLGLITQHIIGEASFVLLLCISAFIGLVVSFIDRIQSFSLRELSVEMAKVEAARKEVESVALALAEITAFLAAFHRRMGNDETHKIETDWMQNRVERLLDEMDSDSITRSRILRFLSSVRAMDSVRGSDKEEGLRLWREIWKEIEIENKQIS